MNFAINRYFYTLLLLALFNTGKVYGTITDSLTIGSAKALALGNAVTADPPGIDSIHFNPAGLIQFKRREYQAKLISVQYNFTTEFGDYDQSVLDCVDQVTCVGNFSDPSFQDEARFSKSETTTPSLMLPFAGLTEFPVDFLAAPLAGFAYKVPNHPMVIGTSVYVPMGAGYKRDEDDPGKYFGKEFSLARITYLSPSLAYQFGPHLTVGVSLGLSWMGVGLNTDLRVPNQLTLVVGAIQEEFCDVGELVDLINVCGERLGPFSNVANLNVEAKDPLSVTYNLGVLWEPTPWLTWGMVFQSEGENSMEGPFTLDYGSVWENLLRELNGSQRGAIGDILAAFNFPEGKAIESGKARIDIATPMHISTGISVRVTPAVKVNVDLKWTDWGAWESLTFEFQSNQGDLDFLKAAQLLAPAQASRNTLALPRNYKSIVNWAIGVEYQMNSNLAIRAGFEDRPSSIPNESQDVLIQLGDGYFFGTGIEYRLEKQNIFEFSVGYLDTGESVKGGASRNANSTDPDDILYNPYFGLDFKNEAKAVFAEINYRAEF